MKDTDKRASLAKVNSDLIAILAIIAQVLPELLPYFLKAASKSQDALSKLDRAIKAATPKTGLKK